MRLTSSALLSFTLATTLLGAGCTTPVPSGQTASQTQSNQAVTSTAPLAKPSEILIFVSSTCPHCAKVESEVKNGHWDAQLPISFKQVDDHDDNLELLAKKMRACNLPLDRISVPLLWNGRDCFGGDEKIIGYLQSILPNYASTSSTGN